MILAGLILCPVLAAPPPPPVRRRKRQQMAKRFFARDACGSSLHAHPAPEKFPDLDAQVNQRAAGRPEFELRPGV